MKVRDIMTVRVETCTMETTLQEVAEKMLDLDVGSIPVVENGELRGIVTDRDLVIRGIAAQVANDTPVGQILTADPVIGEPDMDVEEAAALMADRQIRRLPVVEGGRLVGIVALGDVAVKDPAAEKSGAALEDISKPAEPDQ